METLSLSQELKKCIESMPDEIRAHFNYYCLGHRDNTICSNEYTLDQYIEKISKAIKERSNLGERFVVFKALNKSREIPKNRIPWKSDIKKMYHSNSYNKCMQYYNDIIEELSSCYISNGSKKIK